MKSKYSISISIPSSIVTQKPFDTAPCLLDITGESEMSSDEQEATLNAVFTGLGMLIATVNGGEDIVQPEAEQKPEARPLGAS